MYANYFHMHFTNIEQLIHQLTMSPSIFTKPTSDKCQGSAKVGYVQQERLLVADLTLGNKQLAHSL